MTKTGLTALERELLSYFEGLKTCLEALDARYAVLEAGLLPSIQTRLSALEASVQTLSETQLQLSEILQGLAAKSSKL